MLSRMNPGVFWQLGGTLCFCLVMTINRGLKDAVPKELFLLGRFFFALFFLAPFFRLRGLFFLWPIQILRGSLTAMAVYCTYSAYRNLPTATMALFGTICPLLVSFLGTIILRERMKWTSALSLFLGMAGVGVVYWHGAGALMDTKGYAPLSSIMGALSIICGRWLIKKGAKMHSMLFYNIVIPLVFSLFFSKNMWSVKALLNWKPLFFVGMVGGFAQYCNVKTMKNLQVSMSAPLEYLRPCILIPVGFFYFGEVPSRSFYWGSCLVCISTFVALRSIYRDKGATSQ